MAVVSTRSDPAELRSFDCPRGRCRRAWLETDRCWKAATVVVAGHSLPPDYLGRGARELARAVACHEPELVVLDTCYGMTLDLLGALDAAGVRALVVGTTDEIPPAGLLYDAAFFSAADPWDRAAAVHPRLSEPLETWQLDPAELSAARALATGLSDEELEARLVRVWPNLARVPLGGAEALVGYTPQRRDGT